MALSAGTRLGPYEILGPIGAGGMGEVYRAKDATLGRDVAIKVLPEALARDPERLARFKHEAKVLASLNHPNIGHIYGVESQALVMELVDGETLGSLLKPGPLPRETALDYARQIAEALEAAHDKGIVHRDLKPSNIMVTPAGVVKVLDFGLAKTVEDNSGASNLSDSPTMTQSPTRAGVILGTAAYMSPEQARGASVDKRSDIWTFGVVLYEMLTGKHAFSGQSVTDILAGILRAEPDWSALPAATPLKIRELLRRCLERDRKQRLQAIAEARIAIDDAASEPVLEQDVRPSPARARVWPWIVAALATALAVTAAFGWWRASRSQPLRPLMRLSVEFGPDVKPGKSKGGGFLALSPDGTLLAVTVRGADGEIRLATRRLDQNQTTTLAGTEDASSPFFSPDGQWIAFFSDRKIKKISAGGGAAVTLCEIGGGITGSWGDDGNIIVPLGWGSGLSRIPSAGGAPAPVTELNHEKSEFRHGWPQVLPGSRAVLFTTEHTGQAFDDADIEVASLKTGERTILHHGGFFARYLPSGHLAWVHHNVLYAAPFDLDRLALTGDPQPVVEDINNAEDEGGDFGFSGAPSGPGSFVYVSAKGKLQRSIFWLDSAGTTRPLLPAPGLYGYPRFSPDGKRLAFSLSDDQNHEDIWVRDLERDTASRVTRLPGQNVWPTWAPDSKNLVFWSSNPAAPGLYWIRADGSGVAQRLTDGKIQWLQLSLSPDGKRLATARVNNSGGVEIWTAPVEGDASHPRLGTPEPFLQTPFVTILPAFSPDGRWLAYTSGEPGKDGLWVVPFPGPGGGWLISSRGDMPVWSRNGHELFFLEDLRTIMVAGYTAKGDAFEFSKPRVWSQHPVLDLGSPPVGAYDVAPDGKRVAVILNADGTADPKPITHLTFLVNFFDELRRRVPAGGK
jgi:Tol biopolymer transport system component/predicted Ser/Thr protein kinase